VSRASTRWTKLVAVGLAVAVLGAGGCYRRVVDARGPGRDQYEVSEPYQQDSKLDRWYYGERSDRRGGSRLDDRPPPR